MCVTCNDREGQKILLKSGACLSPTQTSCHTNISSHSLFLLAKQNASRRGVGPSAIHERALGTQAHLRQLESACTNEVSVPEKQLSKLASFLLLAARHIANAYVENATPRVLRPRVADSVGGRHRGLLLQVRHKVLNVSHESGGMRPRPERPVRRLKVQPLILVAPLDLEAKHSFARTLGAMRNQGKLPSGWIALGHAVQQPGPFPFRWTSRPQSQRSNRCACIRRGPRPQAWSEAQ